MTEILHKSSIEALEKRDPKFRLIRENFGMPPFWQRPQGFETLCKIILEQQVSLESGKAAFEKLNSFIPEFAPKHLIKLSDSQMKKATISRQKTSYLRELSNLILDGSLELEALPELDDDECLQCLIQVKGIGYWTAKVYMMFALKRPDIFPEGDIALINAAKELWDLTNKEEVINRSIEWSPFRTTASYFLWHFYLKSRGRNPVI